MTAADVLAIAAGQRVTISRAGDRLRLENLPLGEAGDALMDLARQFKAELLASMLPPACLLRVWFCSGCGLEVRADLPTCPRGWCRMPRRGPVFDYAEVMP